MNVRSRFLFDDERGFARFDDRRQKFASSLFDAPQTITLSDAGSFQSLVVNKTVSINGKGADLLTVRRDTNSPVAVGFNNMTITGGKLPHLGGAGGGGIFVSSPGSRTSIDNCHITGNTVINGGGVYSDGQVIILNSAVSNNSVLGGAQSSSGGGTTVRNSIVAENTDAQGQPDLVGAFNSEGFNLFKNTSGATVNETQNAGTNIIGQYPKVGALRNNGGQTPTHALLNGSPAIDKGKSFGLTTDQRGLARPVDSASAANAAGGDGADIGAFEVQNALQRLDCVRLLPFLKCSGGRNLHFDRARGTLSSHRPDASLDAQRRFDGR